ncbi:hypothetical protein CYY_003698 [Polysphondylium violaceum]|uniref:Peptidase M8 n=1 Tax=Polysphondylium violaceum TaxID=133409 RepID=A0A8J4V5R7_9MYCE|nr:hypothetical protein CYY_003698 [Polysphondylium violaceum]
MRYLFNLFICLFLFSSLCHGIKVNDIIDSYYKEFSTQIESTNQQQQLYHNGLQQNKRARAIYNPPTSKKSCIHDEMVLDKFIKKDVDNMGPKKSNKLNIPLAEEYVKDDVGTPIKFFANSTYIDNDELSCRKVGQKVIFSKSTETTTRDCVLDDYGVVTNSPCKYTCTENDILTPELQNLIKNFVVNATIDIFQSLLRVRNHKSNLKLIHEVGEKRPVQCSKGVFIPESLYIDGIDNVDHYLFITSRPTPDPNTIAYSIICDAPVLFYGEKDEDWVYGRPQVSVLNFNPSYFLDVIRKKSKWDFNKYLRVGIHEMVHSLGFSSFLYESFIDPETGAPYYFSGQSVVVDLKIPGMSPAGSRFLRQRSMITSPSVVEYSKKHFGCSDAIGFELEDSGGSGTKGSHWEKRTGAEEIMTGYISELLPVTNLTLSLLYDTGWYIPNFAFGEEIGWGKNMGCDWMNDCNPSSWNQLGYFCEKRGQLGCTANRDGKGVCQVKHYSASIPGIYQHFNSTTFGGSDKSYDYCPFYQVRPAINRHTSYCANFEFPSDESINEEYGEGSKCFEYEFKNYPTSDHYYDSDDSDDNNSYDQLNLACWVHRCNAKNRSLEIKINNFWYTCSGSEFIDVLVPKGTISIKCPYDMCPYEGFKDYNTDKSTNTPNPLH